MKSLPRVWNSAASRPPCLELLEVRLVDKSVTRGIWTGVQWWCDGHAVEPLGWRPVVFDRVPALATR